jgi:RNA polymerase sigma-70 factor, ECF subfamily
MTMTLHSDPEFAQHVEREERALLRFVMGFVPSLDDAREIVQETVTLLWEQRAEFDAARPFLPWACGFARMKVREFVRRRARWLPLADEELLALVERRRAELEPELNIRRDWLQHCLEKLGEPERSIVTGYYFDEVSVVDLGRRYGKSSEAVYKLLQRLRRALFDCVNKQSESAKGGAK